MLVYMVIFDKDIVKLAVKVNEHTDIQRKLGNDYEQSKKQLSTVISGISHDFRTPLTASLGYLQMIEKSGALSEKNAEYLAVAEVVFLGGMGHRLESNKGPGRGKGDAHDLREGVFVWNEGWPHRHAGAAMSDQGANNANGEFYGMERLTAALNRCAGMSPQGILEGVKADVDAFTGDASQFDDLTMLCLCYKGRTPRQEST